MIQHITKPFIYFFKLESASGLLLLFAAVIAMFVSNSNFSEDYFTILQKYILLGTESFGLKLTILHWINWSKWNLMCLAFIKDQWYFFWYWGKHRCLQFICSTNKRYKGYFFWAWVKKFSKFSSRSSVKKRPGNV